MTRKKNRLKRGRRHRIGRLLRRMNHNSSFLSNHGFHILNMSQLEYVKVQKHCRNQSFLVTIPFRIAKAIPITQGDLMKAVLDDSNRVILEKI